MTPAQMDSLARAEAFLAELGERGLRLRPLPEGRIYVEPASAVDAETAERIRAMRSPLLEALARPTWPCVRCSRFAFTAPTVCYWCRHAEEWTGHA